MATYVPTYFLGQLIQKQIAVNTDTFKVALYTGTVPSTYDTANEYYGGTVYATEASGTGYTAGGNTVTVAQAIYTTGGVHNWCASIAAGSTSWATATLASVTYAVLYDFTSSTKWGAVVWDFGGAQSVTANTFTINFSGVGAAGPASTVFYLSVSP